MKVTYHITASSVLSGVLYLFTGSLTISLSALIGGVMIDLDHVFDYLVFANEKLTIKNFLQWCYNNQWDRISLVFHSWEFLLIFLMFCVLYQRPLMIGIFAGTGLHLAMDQLGNPVKFHTHKLFYFFSFRMAKGFCRENMIVVPYGVDK